MIVSGSTWRRLAAIGLAVLTVSACSSNDANEDGANQTEKVTYVTGFGATGQESFAWVAKEKGYFQKAGLDVDIQLGAGSDNNLKLVTSGQAQFSHIDMTGGIISAGTGTFKDIKFIAATHQRTLVSIISVEGYGITTPKDLEGKKIAAATGSVNQKLFPAYAKLAGIDANKVTFENAQAAQVVPLVAQHKVDAIGNFLLRRPDVEKASGKKAVVLPYSDFLSDLYGGAIVTSDKVAKEKPELAKRFQEALMEGLEYTIAHPDEAGQILHKYQQASDATVAADEVKLMAPYSTAEPIGTFSQQRVARGIALIQASGLIPSGLTPEGIVDFDAIPQGAS